jgi:hypothetical protein
VAVCISAGTLCDFLNTSTNAPRCDATAGSCARGGTRCGGLGQACCLSSPSDVVEARYCAAPGTRCVANPSSSTTPYICEACTLQTCIDLATPAR